MEWRLPQFKLSFSINVSAAVLTLVSLHTSMIGLILEPSVGGENWAQCDASKPKGLFFLFLASFISVKYSL